jgi:hypothetical protein
MEQTMPQTRTSAQKLAEAVAVADEKLRPYRRNRLMFLRQYAGPYFGHAGAGGSAAEPLNTIYSVVSVVLPHLVSCNPKAMIRTPFAELRATADTFALAWNHVAAEIDLGRSLRTVVTDALFGAGIMKTGLAPAAGADRSRGAATSGGAGENADGAGYQHDPGEPFADPVDLDDYVIDPAARRREEAAFEGNRYRVPREYLLESGLFDRAEVEKLLAKSASSTATASGGDDFARRADGRAEELWRGGSSQGQTGLPGMVELIDLWLPREGVVVTLAAGEPASARYLREAAWQGPRRGPYEMLGFHWVSGNVLPVPPVGLFYDLHVMINKLARKQARAADRQKDLVLFDDRASEEAQRLRDAFDGEMIGVQNVDRYRQVSFGGPHEETYAQLKFLFEQFGRVAGNVDLLGGLAPVSDTLGQDEMLFESASVRIEDMRSQVYECTKHVGGKLAWYLWNDPLVDLPLVRRGEGGREVLERFNDSTRRGEWLDYHFDVEPHSMTQDTPTRKYRRVLEWIQNVLLPTAPIAQAQGLKLDVERLAKLTGAMLNIEEAPQVFVRAG